MHFGLSALVALCFLVSTGIACAQSAEGPRVAPQVTSSKNISYTPNSKGQSSSELTLAEALTLALQHNPTLAAFDEEIRAKDAATLQAGLLPNPDLAVEVENFAGEDELDSFDGAETTISLSQLLELGGKRSKRQQIASLEKDLADWDYQSQKLDILAATTKEFVQLLATQQLQMQTEELVRLAEQTLEAVTARVEAGKVPPLEKIRAQVEQASARTEAGKVRRELNSARQRLAARWGAVQVDFAQAVGDLSALEPLPAEATLRDQLQNNPDLARWDSELAQRKVSLSLARSQAIPDLTLSLGIRNFQETNSNALVAGIELPLPFFDRNQGGIAEAGANQNRARRVRRATEIELQSRLTEAWQNLAAAYEEATALRDEILPGARSAFEAAELGYREGKFGFLQLLDAQRTLFEVKGQSLQSLAAYHQARTEVDRLIGSSVHNLLQPATDQNRDKR